MMSVEQLLYFDKLRSGMNAQIEKHERKIFEARQAILAEEESIRHLEYDIGLMVTVLDQTDSKWPDKINNYYKNNS